MESIFQIRRPPPSLHFSCASPSSLKPISTQLRIPPPSPSLNFLPCIKLSCFSSPKPLILSLTIVRHSCVAITAAALFLANLTHTLLPAVASPLPPPMVESGAVEQDDELGQNNYLADSNPDDVKALQSLMECKVRSHKVGEAIVLLERLIRIEPDNIEWALLRANLYSFNGDCELAKTAFEEVLNKDPLCVEAYHGIVMALSQSPSGGDEELREMLDRISVAVDRCGKDDDKKEDLRDFKLLLAQIKVLEGNYGDALKVYQDLAVEEPTDFRPYLCQGIVYTLLRREEEAKIQFDIYKRLVPEDHPYAQYLEDNMFGSMGMSHRLDNQPDSEKRLLD
uniref:Chloroplast lumen common family protein n=1 Tax=Kalanchoe fedtschenkoi TaxID=63787 RepID=A0A7N0TJA9_KALFE